MKSIVARFLGPLGRLDSLGAYYLATPLFALADFGFGMPVRVWGLHDPVHRGVYYGVVFALGLLCRARPRTAPFVGMAESVTNLLLVMLAILIPIWSLPDALLSGAETPPLLTGYALGNAALSGSVLVMSFYRQRLAAWRVLASRVGGDAGAPS